MQICDKCQNGAWETAAQVAACNCCETGEYFDPLPGVQCDIAQERGCCFSECTSLLKGKLEECPEEIRIEIKEDKPINELW